METDVAKRKEMLDQLWDTHKAQVEKDHEGEYIVFDNQDLENSGISPDSLKAPGNFSSLSAGEPGYFLRKFGKGRSKLFRRLIK